MVMALSLFYHDDALTLAAGYENGLAVVGAMSAEGTWATVYRTKAHSQPILSLDVSFDKSYFLTSSADAIIAKHPVPSLGAVGTKPTVSTARPTARAKAPGISLLSEALSRDVITPAPITPRGTEQASSVTDRPLMVINTKHSGQQSLSIRSDGRIFATAGWDAKVRVYSTKTLREVAVLKWHQTGCFAVAFSEAQRVGSPAHGEEESSQQPSRGHMIEDMTATSISKHQEMSVKEKRIHHAATAHWVAAGSKDGKVSLWDIF